MQIFLRKFSGDRYITLKQLKKRNSIEGKEDKKGRMIYPHEIAGKKQREGPHEIAGKKKKRLPAGTIDEREKPA